MTDPCAVKVAVRVRPLISHEVERGCKGIVEVISQNDQVVLKTLDNKGFTFNYVLGADTPQDELYNRCVAPLLKNLFEGLNVTIFAYGQTGSGKTHTMGTSYDGGDSNYMGVIPRAINEIFKQVNDNFSVDFTITVSFTELYREVLYDLLANKPRDQCTLEIREDTSKGIVIPNLTEVAVESAEHVLSILRKGSLGRATASTNMNKQSSRSHSIFTVNLAMQHRNNSNENKMAKLHLVDLAGSERPKKTGAQGTTFKEGVDINKGLFTLGNVISALGDEKTQNGFICYRDSNLTRLLKDSLGGNSVTLMIACISPADYNLEETVSTLRYADRARKIKNKPIVNQDPKVAEINTLKKQIKQLQLQIVGQGGPIVSACEIEKFQKENDVLNFKIRELKVQLSATLLEKTSLQEKLQILENANTALSNKLTELRSQCDNTFHQISLSVENNDLQSVKANLDKLQEIQTCFNGLREEQVKVASQMQNHEETFGALISTARNSTGSSSEAENRAACHTDRQMKLNSEYHQVTKQLAVKEQLAAQLAANTQRMIDSQIALETKKTIEALEKEKDELMQQLRTMKSQENSTKLAEQRRKRVQELEDQLKDWKKKALDQSKLLKLREKDELKMKQLYSEISNMKSIKVRLVKQMREESEKYRAWKQVHDRELAKVKQQDRKKETEIAKMKVTYEKQKNVLKRKFEEAAALNKRLQANMMKRKQAQETRFVGKAEKVAAWLKEEMEVFVNLMEAESTLTDLLEDRATLQHQLDELKANPETAECPEIKSLEEDIELRSVQIQDLQQKVLDSDEENKSKTRFDTVQTMVEAKFALRGLFEQAAQYHRNYVQAQKALTEVQESNKELLDKVEKQNTEIETIQTKHADQLEREQNTYQEKVGILLKQMSSNETGLENADDKLLDRCKIQNEKIEHQEKVIEEQNAKIADLEKKLKDIYDVSQKAQTPIGKKLRNRDRTTFAVNTYVHQKPAADLDVTFDTPDNIETDPDWRNTPLVKQMAMFKNSSKVLMAAQNLREPNGTKRSFEGGCACKKCNTQRCKCKKLGNPCTNSCKCSSECCNKETSNDTSSELKFTSATSSVDSIDESNESKRSKENSCLSLTRRILRAKKSFSSSFQLETNKPPTQKTLPPAKKLDFLEY